MLCFKGLKNKNRESDYYSLAKDITKKNEFLNNLSFNSAESVSAGFQFNILNIFNDNNNMYRHFVQFSILLIFRQTNNFYQHTYTVACMSPVVLSDLWKYYLLFQISKSRLFSLKFGFRWESRGCSNLCLVWRPSIEEEKDPVVSSSLSLSLSVFQTARPLLALTTIKPFSNSRLSSFWDLGKYPFV
jgi:hypothetical protein